MKKGFTLLELVIVIIILGILATIAIPRYFANIENARKAEALSSLSRIREAEQAYYSVNSVYIGLPINVDIDGDGIIDIGLATPQSMSFTYSVPSTDASAGYAEAAKTAAKNSYGMCLSSGKVRVCVAAAACNPGCP